MVCDQGELPTVEVLMEPFHSKNQGECFLLQLGIILFTAGEGPGSKCNWMLSAVRKGVRNDCTNAVS